MSIPHDPVLVHDRARQHDQTLVVTRAAGRGHTLSRIVQVHPLCTDTAVHWREGEVAAGICVAEAAAGPAAGRDVVRVDHAAGARAGVLA